MSLLRLRSLVGATFTPGHVVVSLVFMRLTVVPPGIPHRTPLVIYVRPLGLRTKPTKVRVVLPPPDAPKTITALVYRLDFLRGMMNPTLGPLVALQPYYLL